ncbi:MAG: hypothetical protein NTZ74_04520 [Chloroflexi bacterium]|nr:hypothetical protein [Chloroflexota bacterium]
MRFIIFVVERWFILLQVAGTLTLRFTRAPTLPWIIGWIPLYFLKICARVKDSAGGGQQCDLA